MNMPSSKLENTCETTAMVGQTAALLRPTGKKIAREVSFGVFIYLLENAVKQVELQMIYFSQSFHICVGGSVPKI